MCLGDETISNEHMKLKKKMLNFQNVYEIYLDFLTLRSTCHTYLLLRNIKTRVPSQMRFFHHSRVKVLIGDQEQNSRYHKFRNQLI